LFKLEVKTKLRIKFLLKLLEALEQNVSSALRVAAFGKCVDKRSDQDIKKIGN
jgi:hypothetical protein